MLTAILNLFLLEIFHGSTSQELLLKRKLCLASHSYRQIKIVNENHSR